MENINKLKPNELDEITEFVLSTISSLVKMADKHNIDRDSLMRYFAATFTNLVEVSTFKYFPTDEQKDNQVFTCKDCEIREKRKGAKMENIDKIESLCKALRCIASKNSNGECYGDIHKNMLCIKNDVGEYSACPYFQDTYSINNLSWLSEVADILDGKAKL